MESDIKRNQLLKMAGEKVKKRLLPIIRKRLENESGDTSEENVQKIFDEFMNLYLKSDEFEKTMSELEENWSSKNKHKK